MRGINRGGGGHVPLNTNVSHLPQPPASPTRLPPPPSPPSLMQVPPQAPPSPPISDRYFVGGHIRSRSDRPPLHQQCHATGISLNSGTDASTSTGNGTDTRTGFGTSTMTIHSKVHKIEHHFHETGCKETSEAVRSTPHHGAMIWYCHCVYD